MLGVFTTAEAEVSRPPTSCSSRSASPPTPKVSATVPPSCLARMKKNREEFERRIDDGVKAAVAKVRAPIDKEIASLKSRLEQVQARFEELQKRGRSKKDG